MKKSEMIDKIKGLIEINLEILSQFPDASLVAGLILYMQEEQGMLPPATYDEVKAEYPSENSVMYSYFLKGKPVKRENLIGGGTWEPEDETK